MKQELADLAVVINMESQKAQDQERQYQRYKIIIVLICYLKISTVQLIKLLNNSEDYSYAHYFVCAPYSHNVTCFDSKTKQQKHQRVDEDREAENNLKKKLS